MINEAPPNNRLDVPIDNNLNAIDSKYKVINEAQAKLQIPWANIWAWISTYGLQYLLEVLSILAANYSHFGNLTPNQVVAWITEALAAIVSNQPLPPFPTPVSTGDNLPEGGWARNEEKQ